MAKGDRTRKRREGRMKGQALQMIVFGVLLLLVPALMRNSLIGKALASAAWIGWLLLVAGGVFLWLSSTKKMRAPEAGPAPSMTAATRAESRAAADPVIKATEGEAVPRPTTWSASVFDVIEWRRFEAVVEELFRQAGFETRSQSHGADGGVDIWLHSRNAAGAPVSLVQCKHWAGKKVGVDKIRELRGVMAAHQVQRGQFATSSTFTPDAQAFARDNGIKLHDAEGLLALIAQRSAEQQQALLAVALEGEYWRPTCASCGVKMVDRKPRAGGTAFWGCTNFPRCKTTLPMRASA